MAEPQSEKNKTMNLTARQCILCDRPESADNLVQCDRCDQFVHYSCAEVNDSISAPDRSFVCTKCTEGDDGVSVPSRRSSRSSRSSRRSAKLALDLQKLEEESRIRMQQIDEAERFRQMRFQAEQELIQKRFQLLQADLTDDDDADSRKSRMSSRVVQKNTEKWVQKEGQTEGASNTTAASSSNNNPQPATSACTTPTAQDAAAISPMGKQNVASMVSPEVAVSSTPKNDSTRSEVPPDVTTASKGDCSSFKLVPVPSSGSGVRFKVVEVSPSATVLPSGPDQPVSSAIASGNSVPVVPTLTASGNVTTMAALQQTPISSAAAITSSVAQPPPGTISGVAVTAMSMLPPMSIPRVRVTVPSAHVQMTTSVPSAIVSAGFVVPPTSDATVASISSALRRSEQMAYQVDGIGLVSTAPSLNTGYRASSSSASLVPQPPPGLEPSRYRTILEYDPSPLVPPSGPNQAAYNVPITMNSSLGPWNNRAPPEIRSMASVPPPGPDLPPVCSFPTISSSSTTVPLTYSSMLPRTSYYDQSQGAGAVQAGYDHPYPTLNTSVPRVAVTTPAPYGSGQNNYQNAFGPNSMQIAARQVIPRDLPVFAGDPQDWPIFYSSFRNSTEVCGYSDAENLARLQRCLRGHALEAVRSRLLIPESVPHVLATLQRLYGRPEVIINALLRQLRNVPSPKADDLKTLIRFGMAVQNLVEHMIVAEQQQHLSNPMLLYELVERLPSNFKLEWANYKHEMVDVNLSTFSDFMARLVAMASDVTMHVDPGYAANMKSERNNREKLPKEKLFMHHTKLNPNQDSKERVTKPSQDSAESTPVKTCAFCNQVGHRIADCGSFKRLDVDGRWRAVREKGLCRICLVPHKSWPCRSKRECGFENCRLRHNTLLHSAASGNSQPSTSNAPVTESNIAHQNHHFQKICSLLRYLPITLFGNGKQVEVFAFLDDGSTSTIMEAEVAKLLGVEGPEEPLHLCWTSDVTRVEEKSQRIQLMVSGTSSSQQYPLSNIRTVKQLKLPSQTLKYEDICHVHPYLKALPIRSYVDAVPRVIIGVDNVKLISALKVREGGQGRLIAAKTRLGWTVYGRHSEAGDMEHLNLHVGQEKQAPDNAMLHELMKQFFNIEESSVTTKPESEDNKRAADILESTTVRVPTGFEVGLLWKKKEYNLPDTYPLAVRRLKCLEKRLLRSPDLHAKVKELVQSYIDKGYAHRASNSELESVDQRQTWYLPLGVVQNPKKPNKIRLIWDAAATVEGLSFNDLLLKGPDLMVSLIAVLIKFRERNVAIGGDLREMFHQIMIRAADKQFLRFLWRECPEDPPQVYVMDVAIFGASCSPCIAQFVKNRNAEEFAEEFPRAAKAITDNHYVDDYLDSVDTVEEAVELMGQVKYIHANGGFEIRQFVSNSKEVLRNLGVLQEIPNKCLNLDSKSERVLGMFWIPDSDIFTFTSPSESGVSPLDNQPPTPTKRQVLRIIMSVFDPLGLIAHFIVHGKILMQHIWRAGTNWDELIPEHLRDSWNAWQDYLSRVNEIKIPRCLLGCTRSDQERVSEIHAFVDASRQAYACAIYLRTVGESGVECSLIIAKSKVAPLKPVSIPRLELQAALIGARLMENVCQNLTLPVTRRVFWSDSSTVLSWLNSDAFRYHQYVAFRVGEILSKTRVNEWRYVPSKQNVADDATKWQAGPDFSTDSRWFNGPKFLRQPESEWPAQPRRQETTEEQVKQLYLHREVIHDPIMDVSRFSSWSRLHRTTAFVCRARILFKNKGKVAEIRAWLSSEELTEAEKLLWRQVQKEAFPREYQQLKTRMDNNGEIEPLVDKTSPLYKLSPFMDESGVIRMGSRIGAAPFAPYEAKYPIILPKNHSITFLLTDSYHRRLLHANNETVFNDMRQRFYVPALRRLVRRVAAECQQCKICRAVPEIPRMSPLPRARLTPFVKPFTYIGIDYFGPISIKVGRSQAKRWVALFTCLTIRAVHMEVVHSLSTHSCVMAFRRFVARRGAPLEVYSDNGTCFVGANRQLKKEINQINESCAATFTNARTKWIFNPPAAPHMGGLWERMVRSVKTAMLGIGDGLRNPNEETFETIVLEAEAIVNSRPLTYVGLESADQEALTPNHFLLYGSQGVNQPAVQPVEYRGALRDSWKLTQWMIDQFWRRWIREYLPVLTRRSKWFEPAKPIQVGDVVVVVDDAVRNQWLKGRILEVFTASDGQVRRAKVQTIKGTIVRPTVKLAVLDVFGIPRLHGSGNVTTTTGSAQAAVQP